MNDDPPPSRLSDDTHEPDSHLYATALVLCVPAPFALFVFVWVVFLYPIAFAVSAITTLMIALAVVCVMASPVLLWCSCCTSHSCGIRAKPIALVSLVFNALLALFLAAAVIVTVLNIELG